MGTKWVVPWVVEREHPKVVSTVAELVGQWVALMVDEKAERTVVPLVGSSVVARADGTVETLVRRWVVRMVALMVGRLVAT